MTIFETMSFRRVMYGGLFTLGNVERNVFRPTMTAVVLSGSSELDLKTERVTEADPRYSDLVNHLDLATKHFTHVA